VHRYSTVLVIQSVVLLRDKHDKKHYVASITCKLAVPDPVRDADCRPGLWVDGLHELEGVGLGEIHICGGD
jgi:hypothetical protein